MPRWSAARPQIRAVTNYRPAPRKKSPRVDKADMKMSALKSHGATRLVMTEWRGKTRRSPARLFHSDIRMRRSGIRMFCSDTGALRRVRWHSPASSPPCRPGVGGDRQGQRFVWKAFSSPFDDSQFQSLACICGFPVAY
jgi:hypothetical protein